MPPTCSKKTGTCRRSSRKKKTGVSKKLIDAAKMQISARREPGVDRFVTSAIVGGAEGSLEFDDDASRDVQSEMHKLIRYQRSMRENLEEKGCTKCSGVRTRSLNCCTSSTV